jgi:hypothetical protein
VLAAQAERVLPSPASAASAGRRKAVAVNITVTGATAGGFLAARGLPASVERQRSVHCGGATRANNGSSA